MTPPSQPPLTAKQKREANRAEKVAALKKKQAVQKRNRLIGVTSAIVGGVAVIALLVGFVVTSAPSNQSPAADPGSIEIDGLTDFGTLPAVHVGPEPVDYEAKYDMNPPAGGDHFAAWLNCGVYEQPQVNENAVHSLEHGAIWVTYDPDALSADEVESLRAALPTTYSVLSPYPGLPAPVVASAWANQVQLNGPDDPRLAQFIEKFWQSPNAPEPGAPCTGAIDGPGKVG